MMLFAYMATFCQKDFFLSVILFKIWHDMSEKKSNFLKNSHMGVAKRHISIFKAVIEKSL